MLCQLYTALWNFILTKLPGGGLFFTANYTLQEMEVPQRGSNIGSA